MTDPSAQQVIAAELMGETDDLEGDDTTEMRLRIAASLLVALGRHGYRLLPPGEPDDDVPRGGKAFSAVTPVEREAWK